MIICIYIYIIIYIYIHISYMYVWGLYTHHMISSDTSPNTAANTFPASPAPGATGSTTLARRSLRRGDSAMQVRVASVGWMGGYCKRYMICIYMIYMIYDMLACKVYKRGKKIYDIYIYDIYIYMIYIYIWYDIYIWYVYIYIWYVYIYMICIHIYIYDTYTTNRWSHTWTPNKLFHRCYAQHRVNLTPKMVSTRLNQTYSGLLPNSCFALLATDGYVSSDILC